MLSLEISEPDLLPLLFDSQNEISVSVEQKNRDRNKERGREWSADTKTRGYADRNRTKEGCTQTHHHNSTDLQDSLPPQPCLSPCPSTSSYISMQRLSNIMTHLISPDLARQHNIKIPPSISLNLNQTRESCVQCSAGEIQIPNLWASFQGEGRRGADRNCRCCLCCTAVCFLLDQWSSWGFNFLCKSRRYACWAVCRAKEQGCSLSEVAWDK